MKEYSVTESLPSNGEKVSCFGHRTFCCSCDMEKEAAWHDVIFKLEFICYKLLKKIPEDPEASILEYSRIKEIWRIDEGCDHHDDDEPIDRVIGVSKWKYRDTE